jgi:hypothetical protein
MKAWLATRSTPAKAPYATIKPGGGYWIVATQPPPTLVQAAAASFPYGARQGNPYLKEKLKSMLCNSPIFNRLACFNMPANACAGRSGGIDR